MPTIRVRVHPQAWVNNNAVDVDPEGETDFDCPWFGDLPRSDSEESDDLRDFGPEWVRDWSGPFYVEVGPDD